ncbi:MucB/RseB C-terminal domain-containing protein [Eionea flava]
MHYVLLLLTLLLSHSVQAQGVIDSKKTANGHVTPSSQSYKELTIENLLNDVVNANRHFSYKGLLTYEANGSLNTLSLDQRIDASGEFTRVYQTLAFLNGESRRVLREQELNYCVGGNTRWGLWPSVFNQEALKRSYDVRFEGQSRVAGRQALSIYFAPKNDDRYAHRFDIDQKTGLILRSAVVESANIVERMQFVSLSLNQPSVPSDSTDGENYAISWRVPEVEPCHTEQFQSSWVVEWLPEGFSSAGNRITAQGEQVLMFTDGLVSVSVFITSRQHQDLPKVTARRGATIAVLSPLSFNKDKLVAVVGEIPTATARRMAVSVQEK